MNFSSGLKSLLLKRVYPADILRKTFLGTFFLLVFLFTLKAQDLNKVTKIVFHYKHGQYTYDTGRYEIEEFIEFLPGKNRKFSGRKMTIIKRYVQNPVTKQNDIDIHDTTINTLPNKISSGTFQLLLNKLNRTENNFTKQTLSPYLTINKKEILAIAEKHQYMSFLTDDETGKLEGFAKDKIQQIKKLYLLDSFLFYRKPQFENEIIATDIWNGMSLTFYAQPDTIKYSFSFLFQLLGQPFSKMTNNNYRNNARFINAHVNGLIVSILPANSYTREVIGFDRFKEEYIIWCLKKLWS